jgi:hypothetical protein
MFRSLLIFGLASSLLAICQVPAGVTVNGGYVAPAMPGPPILTPPNAALPGSGPATGAPPAVGVNDSRYGGAGSVFEPSGGTLIGSELSAAPSTVVATGASNAPANGATAKTLSVGMGEFVDHPANQPEKSLGDIAREYKTKRANAHPRQFDNNNVPHASYGTPDTNVAALPQGDQANATYGSNGNASVPEGVLNRSDYAAVQAALARSQAASNTTASNDKVASAMPDPNQPYAAQDNNSAQQPQPSAAPQNTAPQNTNDATTPQVDNQANNRTTAPAKKQLPASASSLPTIALLGLFALMVGGVFTYRLRRAEVRN